MKAIREARGIAMNLCHIRRGGGFAALCLSISLSGCTERTALDSSLSQSGTNHGEVETEGDAAEGKASGEAPGGDIATFPASVEIDFPEFSTPYGLERVRVERAELPDVEFSDLKFPAVEDAHVEALIASLAGIEKSDFGLSPTFSGTAFLPLPGQRNVGTLLFTDHQVESSDALVELVKLGPVAIPALLAHLDDTTPTKLVINHEGGFGGMWFANELRGNPLNALESAVLRNYEEGDSTREYTVKVGDVCLVAIGQITGRDYQAVRYQPSLCIVLNSPTHDVGLCEQVRRIWGGDDPLRRYFDFLLLDYATREKCVETGESRLYRASRLQCSAATRLLYYFPDAFAPVIAARIDGLDLSEVDDSPPHPDRPQDPGPMTFWDRNAKNEVATTAFLEAVAWSEHPVIVAALQRAAERTTDEGIREALRNVASPVPDTARRSTPGSSAR